MPFRFTEEVPPGEEGPFPSEDSWAHNSRPTFFLGRLTMAYRLSRKLAAEIEANFSSHTTDHLADLQFTSTVDGLEYSGPFGNHESVNSTSILFGLSFKLLPPTTLQPHAIEISAAAGPAWIGTAAYEWSSAKDRITVDRATKLTARLRASYD